jgi:hypothetical protein
LRARSSDRDEAIDESQDNDGVSTLLLATQRGSLPMVLALLSAGADPAAASAATPHGATPLYVACQRGDCDIVEALIDHGAPTDQVWRSSKGVPFTVRDIAAYVRPRCVPLLALLDLAGSQMPKLLAAQQRLAVAKLHLRRLQPATSSLLSPAVLGRISSQCFVVQPHASLSVCRRTIAQRDVTELLDDILHVIVSTATAADESSSASSSCSFAAATARLVFDEYDRDCDGALDRYEMQCVLQQEVVWLLPGEELTRAEWERLCRVLFGGCNPVLGVPKAEWCAWYLEGLELPPRAQQQAMGRNGDSSAEHLVDPLPNQVTPVPRTPPKATVGASNSDSERETLLSFWAKTDPEGLRHEVQRRQQGSQAHGARGL